MAPVRLLLLTLLLVTVQSHAWDATAHRLNAYLVHERLSPALQASLDRLILQHPRYEQDFRNREPDWLANVSDAEKQRWRFGQAAVWPDLARGLSRPLRQRYDRPDWHWIDGHWMPAESTPDEMSGNVYLNVQPLPAIHAGSSPQEPTNIMEALDFMLTRLLNETLPSDQRAVALCWVLHLGADLHQPLHSGALFSPARFPEGDRGGNGIRTSEGNLHAVWDRALRGEAFTQQLESLHGIMLALPEAEAGTESTVWLMESRELLHEQVYTPDIREHVSRHEAEARLPALRLQPEYLLTMEAIARQRIALGALRLGTLLEERMR